MIYIWKAVRFLSKQGQTPASLTIQGQLTKDRTVKWSIEINFMLLLNPNPKHQWTGQFWPLLTVHTLLGNLFFRHTIDGVCWKKPDKWFQGIFEVAWRRKTSKKFSVIFTLLCSGNHFPRETNNILAIAMNNNKFVTKNLTQKFVFKSWSGQQSRHHMVLFPTHPINCFWSFCFRIAFHTPGPSCSKTG